jgi:hypothetical protein
VIDAIGEGHHGQAVVESGGRGAWVGLHEAMKRGVALRFAC